MCCLHRQSFWVMMDFVVDGSHRCCLSSTNIDISRSTNPLRSYSRHVMNNRLALDASNGEISHDFIFSCSLALVGAACSQAKSFPRFFWRVQCIALRVTIPAQSRSKSIFSGKARCGDPSDFGPTNSLAFGASTRYLSKEDDVWL